MHNDESSFLQFLHCDFLIFTGTTTRRNLLDSSRALYVIQIGEKRNFSALTPVLCCKSPDGAGPSPPPTGGSGKDGDNNKKGTTQCENLPIFLPLRFYVKSIDGT